MAAVSSIATERREPSAVVHPTFLPKKKRKTGRIVALVIVAVAGAIGTALYLRPPTVTTTPVIRGTAIEAVYATAVVEAASRVTVRSKIAGSVAELRVREGQHVTKGDVIAIIDSPTLKYDLERGKVELSAANKQSTSAPRLQAINSQAAAIRSDLAIARKERDRLRELVSTGSAAPSDLERAEGRVESLGAQLGAYDADWSAERIDLTARARGSAAQVQSLAARLEDAEVRAPMDGTVLTRLVESGEVVTQDQAIVRIGDTSNLLLESSVDESDINRVSVGSPAAVSLYSFPGRALNAKVQEILPDADRARKSFIVKIKLDEAPAGLKTGMTGEVNVIIQERARALLAPSEGVDNAGLAWVVRDGHALQLPVRTGIRDMLQVEVLDGLGVGDEVVVAGVETLTDHGRVIAIEKAPHPTSSATPPAAAPPAPSASTTQMDPPKAVAPALAPVAEAVAKPKVDEIPDTIGIIVPPASAHGQPILVDNLWAGRASAKPIRWACGTHNVVIGRRTSPQKIVVPCGGTVTMDAASDGRP
jgi:HlyD family secretion protein